MKLADALRLKSDMNGRLSRIRSRLAGCCLVQEGDEPQDDPSELIENYETISEQLRVLITCINLTNTSSFIEIDNNSALPANVQCEKGKVKLTMTEALATKDILKQRISMYRGLAETAGKSDDDYNHSDKNKFVSMVVPKKIQKKSDYLSKELRLLEFKIQGQAWAIILKDINGDDYITPDVINKMLL